jgi:glycosyltransferase involved in cell wall biosynthesis
MDYPAENINQDPVYLVTKLMYAVWSMRPDLRSQFDLNNKEGIQGFVRWYRQSLEVIENRYDRKPETLPAQYQRGAIFGDAGVNIFGYISAPTGMGELSRSMARSIVAAGLANQTFDIPQNLTDYRELSPPVDARQNLFNINLFNVNADQTINLYYHLGRSVFNNRYNIGMWAWELSEFPDEWIPAGQPLDEIWALSRFTRQSIQKKISAPVNYIPLSIDIGELPGYSRDYYGLPNDLYLFVFSFDANSYIERKNPIALISAFNSAFPLRGGAKVGLVIKAQCANADNHYWKNLIETADDDKRIFVINRIYSREEILGLYAVCDCYVSLHRSEGFGYGPAEAMYIGKPAIVTDYSGTTDFCLPDNSCPVEYTLIPVKEGEYPYGAGKTWADPNPEQAGWFMKKLYSDPAWGKTIGKAASAYMRNNYSPKAVGKIVELRISQLSLR